MNTKRELLIKFNGLQLDDRPIARRSTVNKTLKIIFIFISLLFKAINLLAESGDIIVINNFRVLSQYNNTKIFLDYNIKNNYKLEYKHFTLDNPSRLVLDFFNVNCKHSNIKYNNSNWQSTPIANLRTSNFNKKCRLVFDLNKKIKYKIIVSNKGLVIDLKHELISKNSANYNYPEIQSKKPATNIVKLFKNTKSNHSKESPRLVSMDNYNNINKRFIVMLDPGHGGGDPGAVGLFGTQEKDVVLQIAKYLKQYIDEDKNLKAVLTRDDDYYLDLRRRTRKARLNQADLFISIHADGFKDVKAHGSSVFVLSERGASSELAKWIADHENAADLVGGVSLDNKDQILATVLLDLSQTASNRCSIQVANKVLEHIGVISDLHKNTVERAGFVVLKSPDIPSILIETGFISNPDGERNLRSATYQRRLAYAVYKGVSEYFRSQPDSVIPNWTNKLLQANRN